MSVREIDGGGLIGTPLPNESEASSAKRSKRETPADIVAPTIAVFDARRDANISRSTRRDVHSPVIEGHAVVPPREKGGAALTLDDIMDDDDRRDLQSKAIARRRENVRQAEKRGAALDATVTSFSLASVEPPSVVPREDGPFQSIETTTADSSSVQVDPDYGLAELFSFAARNKTDRFGLGFHDGLQPESSAVEDEKVLPPKRKPNRAFVLSNEGMDEQKHLSLSDDDDFDELANFGYRNLDAVSRRLNQRMKSAAKTAHTDEATGDEKYLTEDAFLNPERMLFQAFEEFTVNADEESDDEDWFDKNEFTVPESFARDPVHRQQGDLNLPVACALPPALVAEHESLLHASRDNLTSSHKRIQERIRAVEEKEDENLKKMKEKFMKEMQSQFAPSSGEKEVKQPDPDTVGTKAGIMKKVGDVNRTTTYWDPPEALSEMFGIVPDERPSRSKKRKLSPPRAELQSNGDESLTTKEDFQVHKILTADGKSVDPRKYSHAFAEEEAIVVDGGDDDVPPPKSTAITEGPSDELFRAVFDSEFKKDEMEGVESERKCKKTDVNRTDSQIHGQNDQDVVGAPEPRRSRWDSEPLLPTQGCVKLSISEDASSPSTSAITSSRPNCLQEVDDTTNKPRRHGIHKVRAADFF